MSRIYPVPSTLGHKHTIKKMVSKCENGADQANRNSLVDTHTHTHAHLLAYNTYYLSRFMAYNEPTHLLNFMGNKRWGENKQMLEQAHTHITYRLTHKETKQQQQWSMCVCVAE